MDIRDLTDDLRKMTDELVRHAGTNEARQISVLSEKMYYLALEVSRIDDAIKLLLAIRADERRAVKVPEHEKNRSHTKNS